LNRDGTTPRDQPQHSPVFATDANRPAGLAWRSASRLWLVTGDAARADQLISISLDAGGRGMVESRVALRARGGGVISYDSPAIPSLEGHLLVAGQGYLLRVHPDGRRSEELFEASMGPFVTLAVSGEGAIHALTDRALWRITDH
jgi:hypothetical protein